MIAKKKEKNMLSIHKEIEEIPAADRIFLTHTTTKSQRKV